MTNDPEQQSSDPDNLESRLVFAVVFCGLLFYVTCARAFDLVRRLFRVF